MFSLLVVVAAGVYLDFNDVVIVAPEHLVVTGTAAPQPLEAYHGSQLAATDV